ncbi:UDP-glucose 4-epimerase GalE (plasmid) [Ensifer sp. PDNC004]|uniref:UDP-glucose 4-epimerase GalE n=1 Tax=Ensifer sp. PDNC004 TaxID=2811423 RepID=UPI0019656765|nr:UDP-glucose 4-epimerase GalE [Ensifer sp. PDNC004]QRY65481.1 UDP-glucose 4-epimerase GalE [Ensifer sp. PDNC004]
MTNILVVGGAGYIGSHACKALHRAGYTPVVYDNLVYGHRDAVKWGPFEEGDILDGDRVDQVLKQYKPACVMHFAAFAYVGESVTDPAKYYANNVSGSLSLLDAMRRNDVGSIIFSSTCATYGEVSELPISEQTPQKPVNPYGFTKLAVEHALHDYGRAYGLKWAAMRYFNAAGCDPEGEIGERHDPETHAIPLAVLAAMGKGEFSVFGTDYDTADGTAVRDYIHVSDLAEAHVLAIDYLAKGGASAAFNLGTGRGTSVKELLTAVGDAVGSPVPAKFAPRRAGDPPMLYASARRARDVLGWQPRFTEIGAIVKTAADWFVRHRS